jgi:hypothetical protein
LASPLERKEFTADYLKKIDESVAIFPEIHFAYTFSSFLYAFYTPKVGGIFSTRIFSTNFCLKKKDRSNVGPLPFVIGGFDDASA